MRTLTPKALLAIMVACVAVALFVMPAIGGDTGTVADIAFIVQMVMLLAGVAALVLAMVALRRDDQAD